MSPISKSKTVFPSHLLPIAGLGLLAFTQKMNFTTGSEILLAAGLIALVPFGAGFFRSQLAALRGNPLRYWPIFRDLTRWSLLGVALTEITVNAHAYLVTFISGPGSFALLALGMLLFRPASLMQSALPDVERPVMARAIAARDMATVARVQHHFSYGLVAAWAVNVILCIALLGFFPALILKKGYDLNQVILVAGLSAVIMAVRAWRTPLASTPHRPSSGSSSTAPRRRESRTTKSPPSSKRRAKRSHAGRSAPCTYSSLSIAASSR